ncbi:MAG: MATE family efflux transporter [Flavobacteriales bacterium]|nr:MATE family efflux transporter [Flavobacteriales bacterium]
MNDTISYRNIWRISYPLILGFVAVTIINVTDTAFLGRVSEVAIGASGLGGIYVLIMLMAAFGLGIGAQIIMARFHGEEKPEKIGPVFDHLMYMLLAMAGGMIVFHFFFAEEILSRIIASEAILKSTLAYTNIRVIGLIPAAIVVGYRCFLTGVSDTRAISYAAGIMAAFNFVFNYLFVFGNWGFPRMEIEGAGYASVLSETFSLLYLIGWVRRKRLGVQFNCFHFPKPNFKQIRSIMRIATPVMVQHIVSIGSWMTFFLIIEGMGERELAISNVVRSGYSVLMIPLIGIGQGTQTLVSKLIGQGGTHLVWTLIKRLILLTVASSVVLMLLNLINPRLLLSVFTNDATLITDSIPVVHVISISIVLFAVAMILLSVVSGTGNTLMTLLIEMSTLIIYLNFTYRMVHQWHQPLNMVWTSEIVYFSFMGLFSALYLWSGKWKNAKVHE